MLETKSAPRENMLLSAADLEKMPRIIEITGLSREDLEALRSEFTEDNVEGEAFTVFEDPELGLTYHYYVNDSAQGSAEISYHGVGTPELYIIVEVEYPISGSFTNPKLIDIVKKITSYLNIFETSTETTIEDTRRVLKRLVG